MEEIICPLLSVNPPSGQLVLCLGENWLENFVSDRCIWEPGARVGARELYEEYKAWSNDVMEKYIRSEKEFSAEMERLGIIKKKSHGVNTYFGLRICFSKNRSNPCYDSEIL